MTSKLLVTTCARAASHHGFELFRWWRSSSSLTSHPTHRPHKRGGVAIMLTSQKGRG